METPVRTDTPDERDLTSPPVPAAPRAGRRWPRRAGRIALVVIAVTLVLGGLTAVVLLGAKGDLDRGRTQLESAKKELVAGDLMQAQADFTQAEVSFHAAASHLGGGLAGILRHVPILGRNLDVARGMAVAGRELSSAGGRLTGAVGALPDGLGSLAPQDGRLPVETIASLTDAVKAASIDADAAQAAADATPSTLLVGPVADARFEASNQVDEVATTLRAAASLFEAFPSFAGADGARHYLVVAESPAELKGTGGIWGAIAVLTLDDGGISFSPFRGFLTLPKPARGSVPAPSQDYARNYGGYGAPSNWTDLNMTPDFPSAAKAALAYYKQTTGETLDGVISADPFALQQLFKVTGPRTIPSLGVRLSAANVIDFTTNEAYLRFARQGKARKEVLGQVVGAAFDTFIQHGGGSLAKLTALAHATSRGHLKIYTVDPAFEQGLTTAGLDGALHAPPGDDLLSVVVNSRSGSKIDYYVTRTVDYDVQLGGDRQAFTTTEVRLRNDAPRRTLPGFVNDPEVKGYAVGDAVSLISISCPGPCPLVGAQRNGNDVAMRVGSELGYPWYQDFFATPAGHTGDLKIVTSRQNAWQGNSSGGTYSLRVLPQTTAKPTKIMVTIHAPAGTRITWTSEPMEVDGGTAAWSGEPQGPLTLEVRFSAPIPMRWARDAIRAIP
jgi:Protein of unknown function (DUF4012)